MSRMENISRTPQRCALDFPCLLDRKRAARIGRQVVLGQSLFFRIDAVALAALTEHGVDGGARFTVPPDAERVRTWDLNEGPCPTTKRHIWIADIADTPFDQDLIAQGETGWAFWFLCLRRVRQICLAQKIGGLYNLGQ